MIAIAGNLNVDISITKIANINEELLVGLVQVPFMYPSIDRAISNFDKTASWHIKEFDFYPDTNP